MFAITRHATVFDPVHPIDNGSRVLRRDAWRIKTSRLTTAGAKKANPFLATNASNGDLLIVYLNVTWHFRYARQMLFSRVVTKNISSALAFLRLYDAFISVRASHRACIL
jgi:hypothetical protein